MSIQVSAVTANRGSGRIPQRGGDNQPVLAAAASALGVGGVGAGLVGTCFARPPPETVMEPEHREA
ncbi:MAG: hypothetical protein ABW318_06655, partial [Vicinamibacterales bacterium]